MTKAIVMVALFLGLSSSSEAQSRWGNCKMLMSTQTGGMVFGADTTVPYLGDFIYPYMGSNNCQLCDSLGNIVLYGSSKNLYQWGSDDTLLPNTIFYQGNYGATAPNQPKTCLLLPMPGNDSLVYYVKTTFDVTCPLSSCTCAKQLNYSIVNMNADSGRGALLFPIDNTILEDRYNVNGMAVAQHANGRDWWIVVKGVDRNFYDFVLLDSAGIRFDHRQYFGSYDPLHLGANALQYFSRDASLFVCTLNRTIDVYQFNRCEGLYYNKRSFEEWDLPAGITSANISPNNRYLYVSAYDTLWQYDLGANSLLDSRVFIAHSFYDSIVSPYFYSKFYQGFDAPDGKIYISNFPYGTHIHAINNPDEGGAACNFDMNNFPMGTYWNAGVEYWRYGAGFPFLATYGLGALQDSCYRGFVGIGEQGASDVLAVLGLVIYPNPAATQLTLYWDGTEPARISIYNTLGQLVLTQAITYANTSFDISRLASGIYTLQLIDAKGRSAVRKWVKE